MCCTLNKYWGDFTPSVYSDKISNPKHVVSWSKALFCCVFFRYSCIVSAITAFSPVIFTKSARLSLAGFIVLPIRDILVHWIDNTTYSKQSEPILRLFWFCFYCYLFIPKRKSAWFDWKSGLWVLRSLTYDHCFGWTNALFRFRDTFWIVTQFETYDFIGDNVFLRDIIGFPLTVMMNWQSHSSLHRFWPSLKRVDVPQEAKDVYESRQCVENTPRSISFRVYKPRGIWYNNSEKACCASLGGVPLFCTLCSCTIHGFAKCPCKQTFCFMV